MSNVFVRKKTKRLGKNLPEQNKKERAGDGGYDSEIAVLNAPETRRKTRTMVFQDVSYFARRSLCCLFFCSEYRGRDRWSQSLAIVLIDGKPIQHLSRPLSRAGRAPLTNVSTLTFLQLSWNKKASLFLSDVAIKCNHSSGVYFPFCKS